MEQIIDVSHWNECDLRIIKKNNPNITGVIIKAGQYSNNKHMWIPDREFEKYYYDASAAGYNIGTYFYSTAHSVSENERETKAFLEAIRGKDFTLPIIADFEEYDYSKYMLNALIEMSGTLIEDAGYYYTVYLNKDLYKNMSEANRIDYAVWLADWDSSSVIDGRSVYGKKSGIVMHQYTSEGIYFGSNGETDTSYMLEDLPFIIRQNGLNHIKEVADTGSHCGCNYCECKCCERSED